MCSRAGHKPLPVPPRWGSNVGLWGLAPAPGAPILGGHRGAGQQHQGEQRGSEGGHTRDGDGAGALGWGCRGGPHMAGEIPLSWEVIGKEGDSADGATVLLGGPVGKGLQDAAIPTGDPDSMARARGQLAHHADHQLKEEREGRYILYIYVQ